MDVKSSGVLKSKNSIVYNTRVKGVKKRRIIRKVWRLSSDLNPTGWTARPPFPDPQGQENSGHDDM